MNDSIGTVPVEQPATTEAHALLAVAISKGVRADVPPEVLVTLDLTGFGSVYVKLNAHQFTALLGGLVTKCEAVVVRDV